MNEYTASNGNVVKDHSSGIGVTIHGANGVPVLEYVSYLNPEHMQALREFFQAEADERLERWRWPECDFFVVYAWKYGVRVVNESVGTEATWPVTTAEGLPPVLGSPSHLAAAYAYFAAHPEPKPAWREAKPGEVWALTVHGEEVAASVISTSAGNLRFVHQQFNIPVDLDSSITAGTRIYPPADPS